MIRPIVLSSLALTLLFSLTGCDDPLGFNKKLSEAQREACVLKIKAIEMSLAAYNLGGGNYPTNEQGLKVLVEKPTTEPIPKRWKQQMYDVPLDPWRNEFIYQLFPDHYTLSSKGENIDDSSDDILIRCEFHKKD